MILFFAVMYSRDYKKQINKSICRSFMGVSNLNPAYSMFIRKKFYDKYQI